MKATKSVYIQLQNSELACTTVWGYDLYPQTLPGRVETRRADRLFQIIQLLRTQKWVTAAKIAEELQVSVRTVYRNVQNLSLSGTPILSETGKGYSLDKAYNLPPVTFSEAEIEALILVPEWFKHGPTEA